VIDRALEFLDYWEPEHVEAVPARQRGQEAVRLAELCRDDVVRAAIALVDLQRAPTAISFETCWKPWKRHHIGVGSKIDHLKIKGTRAFGTVPLQHLLSPILNREEGQKSMRNWSG
jgi:hypothetical protein